MPRRAWLYLWVFPTSCLGLVALVLGSVFARVHTQIVDGVLEVHGNWIEFFLRKCTLLPGGASAMTLGHVVLGCDPLLLDLTRTHERVHVRQCERWGPLFIPAYLFSSLVAWMRGQDAYR